MYIGNGAGSREGWTCALNVHNLYMCTYTCMLGMRVGRREGKEHITPTAYLKEGISHKGKVDNAKPKLCDHQEEVHNNSAM